MRHPRYRKKYPNPDCERKSLLGIVTRIRNLQKRDPHKRSSVHEPAVERISKDKAQKRYEFGCKVRVAATSRGGWFVGASAPHGNLYDSHTLKDAIMQGERIARSPDPMVADMRFRKLVCLSTVFFRHISFSL